jgi:hypothetical protein
LLNLGGTDDSLLTNRMTPPPIEMVDGVGYVSLTHDHFAIVDEVDVPLVEGFTWGANIKGVNGAHKYALSRVNHPQSRQRSIFMHRLIMEARDGPSDLLVDHRNGNGLDNRRSNLRWATSQQNLWNRTQCKAASGYWGVSKTPAGTWRVVFNHSGKPFRLGTFNTPEEAARAYDAKCLELRGEFAVLNFPDEAQ